MENIISLLSEQLTAYTPNIFAAAVILIAGFVLGFILDIFMRKFIKAIKFEPLLKQIGVEPSFLGMPLNIFAGAVMRWSFYLIAITQAVEILSLPFVADTLRAVIASIPSILKAALIFVVVVKIGEYLRSKLVYPKLPQSKIIGSAAYFCFAYLASLLALAEIFPQAASILTTLVVIFLGSLGLAIALGFGLSFGLGTQQIVGKFVAKRVKLK